jgi:GNAT superfamily N-acetyltransferase
MSRRGDRAPAEAMKAAAPTPRFELRPATSKDFSFAKTLYMASMQPLLSALDAWDEAKSNATFRDYFKLEEVRIIAVNGVDIGWIQVSETNGEVHLDQLHLVEPFRDLGIGTRLIKKTQAEARRKERPLCLSFVRGNRAAALYERLGFKHVGSDVTKIHMRWVAGR